MFESQITQVRRRWWSGPDFRWVAFAVALIAAFMTVVLPGCGGGGTGGRGDMAGSGGMSSHGTYTRDNPSAEDLLDHWNEPDPLREAMGLSAVDNEDAANRRLLSFRVLLDAAEGDPTATGTRLRNVQPEELEVIGQREGLTYGRWKRGPAGTLNIEFDWRFAPDTSAATRATMERAGKSWSWRILDDFGTHVFERFEVFHHGDHSVIFDEDVATDGVLIVVLVNTNGGKSTGGPEQYSVFDQEPLSPEEYSKWDDYEAWLGSIALNPGVLNATVGAFSATYVMAHEIGHVLGIGIADVPPVERHINTVDHTFEGPQSMRANGGTAVPFLWLDEDDNAVAPHSPGSAVDYGHVGVCPSLMGSCVTFRPSELDFAYLSDIGYEILDAEAAAEPELYGYGAWGRYSAWGVGVERTIIYEGGRRIDVHDSLRAGVDAFGTAPGVSLGDGHTASHESITWSGSLIGVDLGRAMLPPVVGEAELHVELSTLKGIALFKKLTVLVDGESSGFRASRLEYEIDVTGNSFSDEARHIHGGFFGPAHEEMAGVLDERSSDVNLLAGFGGTR